jgi:hypothetical protein
VDAKTLLPAEWPANPHLEWCPPGHGDLYSALYGSGKLDALLADGVKYMFVSNSDNLGATLDLDLLTYFAQNELPFLMECCERTEADKKGGHLALRKASLPPASNQLNESNMIFIFILRAGGQPINSPRVCAVRQGGRGPVPTHRHPHVLQH